MLGVILDFYTLALDAIERGAQIANIMELPAVEKIARMKYVPEKKFDDEIKKLKKEIADQISRIKVE
jgi:V/A-type H+-transporting ATPase subunit A